VTGTAATPSNAPFSSVRLGKILSDMVSTPDGYGTGGTTAPMTTGGDQAGD
jgi:hypothetical protein